MSRRPHPPAARSWSRWVLVLGLSLAPGCKEEKLGQDPHAWTDDYTFVWEGEHVTVYGYGRSDEDVCAGSFWALETHTRALMDFFGSSDSLHYDYRWLSQEAWEEVGPNVCFMDVAACAWAGEPRSRWLPHMHEIAHAVTYQAPAFNCPAPLSEGLAEYFSEPEYGIGWGLEGDMAEILDRPMEFRFYGRVGHFASFLLETYGVDMVVAMCATIPRDYTLADWDAATQDILGMSIDDLLAEYDDYPECTQQQYRARLWECAGEPDFVFGPEVEEITFEAGCSDPRAMGRKDGTAVITRTVEFPEDTKVVITMQPGETQVGARSLVTQECAPCSADPQIFRYVELPEFYTYRAGVHEIVLFVDLEHGDSVTMVMTRW